MTLTRLGMLSLDDRNGELIPCSAPSLCHNSSNVLAGEGWRADLSATLTSGFQFVTDLEIVEARATFEYPEYSGRSKHDVQHKVLHYLVGRCRLAGLQDRTLQLGIRCQKWICIQIPIDPN
ncbi:hypothetical protein TNCV_3256521 [Trichonephila clavipes]|nr:hypothetical protein TNCV_3256521 [Trichonephila clavipes]